MKITYSVAASLDGFIARENGDVSWLDELDVDPQETGFAEFFSGIDGLIMGRKTYDFVFEYGSWPYGNLPAWVCTRRPLKRLKDADHLRVVADVDDFVQEATQANLQHVWLVGGGQLASAFLERGLIRRIEIAEMPITLVQGIPLFSNHDLKDIPRSSHKTTPKKGFRVIELEVSN